MQPHAVRSTARQLILQLILLVAKLVLHLVLQLVPYHIHLDRPDIVYSVFTPLSRLIRPILSFLQ